MMPGDAWQLWHSQPTSRDKSFHGDDPLSALSLRTAFEKAFLDRDNRAAILPDIREADATLGGSARKPGKPLPL